MSDCENPRFTEKTSTNLGRSHRLPHVCTIMIYGKLGGYRLQEAAAFLYICDEPWIICDIWVSLMWILEKYDDITLKGVSLIWEGPIAYLVFLTISINFHKPMSVEYIFSIAGVFSVAHIILDDLLQQPYRLPWEQIWWMENSYLSYLPHGIPNTFSQGFSQCLVGLKGIPNMECDIPQ